MATRARTATSAETGRFAVSLEHRDRGLGRKRQFYTSLALDSDDSPHKSYHYGTNLDLKYACGDLRTPTILKLTISPLEAHPGEWVTLSGRLTPKLANKRIFLYNRIKHQWKSFGIAITDQQGRYSFEFKIPRARGIGGVSQASVYRALVRKNRQFFHMSRQEIHLG